MTNCETLPAPPLEVIARRDVQGCWKLRPERLWLLLFVAAIIACSLAPFDQPLPMRDLPPRIQHILDFEPNGVEWLAHFSLFFVAGALTAFAHGTDLARRSRASLAGLTLATCALLEALQLFQPARHARIADVILNAIALFCGLFMGLKSHHPAHWAAAVRLTLWRIPLLEALVLVSALTTFWVISFQPLFGSLRLNWDRRFPLVIGNETGDIRPWVGVVRYAGVFNRAMSPDSVAALYASLDRPDSAAIRQNESLIASFDFSRLNDQTVFKSSDESRISADVLQPFGDTLWTSEGAVFPGSGRLQTNGPATAITDRLSNSGAFTVEFWARPDNLSQAGPARMISISDGPALRNFTLGQAGKDIVFRVRNGANGLNGTNHALEAQNVVRPKMQHIVAVYNRGFSNLYVDGKQRASIDLREPVYYSGLATGSLGRFALAILAVLFIYLAGLFVLRRLLGERAVASVACALTFACCVAPYPLVCWLTAGPIKATFPLLVVGILALVCPTGFAYVRERSA